jgi:hypothetical protein
LNPFFFLHRSTDPNCVYCGDTDLRRVYIAALVTAAARYTIDGAVTVMQHLRDQWSILADIVPAHADRAHLFLTATAHLPGTRMLEATLLKGIRSFVTDPSRSGQFGPDGAAESLAEAMTTTMEASILIRTNSISN